MNYYPVTVTHHNDTWTLDLINLDTLEPVATRVSPAAAQRLLHLIAYSVETDCELQVQLDTHQLLGEPEPRDQMNGT